MASATALALLKTDLGLASPSADISGLLTHKIDAATLRLAAMGITIDEDDKADLDLLLMYAGWLYRKRTTNDPMPPMLRLAINDRKVTGDSVDEDDTEDAE